MGVHALSGQYGWWEKRLQVDTCSISGSPSSRVILQRSRSRAASCDSRVIRLEQHARSVQNLHAAPTSASSNVSARSLSAHACLTQFQSC